MTYERRLSASKILASLTLLAMLGTALSNGWPQPGSAGQAILIFSAFVTIAGLVLCWHALFATGRGIRMAMFLVMGVCITAIMTGTQAGLPGVVFIAALAASMMSIKTSVRAA